MHAVPHALHLTVTARVLLSDSETSSVLTMIPIHRMLTEVRHRSQKARRADNNRSAVGVLLGKQQQVTVHGTTTTKKKKKKKKREREREKGKGKKKKKKKGTHTLRTSSEWASSLSPAMTTLSSFWAA